MYSKYEEPIPEPEPVLEVVHPGLWPKCKNERTCDLGLYFNELSCDCWPNPLTQVCDIACIQMNDPRYACSCSPSFAAFLSLFPEWANRSDIERSMGQKFWHWPDEETYPVFPIEPVQ